MKQLLRATLVLLLCHAAAGTARGQLLRQNSSTEAEFRAMHAPSARVVWAGGRGGTFAVTADGGASWRADTIAGAGDLVITGIWARDARTAYAVVTSFGDDGLARIYRTNDGGSTWTMQWERQGDGVFFDALRCWTVERCVAVGDASDGVFAIVRTENGRAWQEVPAEKLPPALAGEGAFAASGTALTTWGTRRAWLGTGVGARARVYATSDGGATWRVAETPLPAGATSGIFGVAFRDSLNGVAVGGDYQKRTERQDNVLRTKDGGRTWSIASASQPEGVRYGVAYATGGPVPGALLAVGPSGAGMSLDDGDSWIPYDTEHWNTLAFAPSGDAWIAGPDGRVAKIPVAAFEGARAGVELRRQMSRDTSPAGKYELDAEVRPGEDPHFLALNRAHVAHLTAVACAPVTGRSRFSKPLEACDGTAPSQPCSPPAARNRCLPPARRRRGSLRQTDQMGVRGGTRRVP